MANFGGNDFLEVGNLLMISIANSGKLFAQKTMNNKGNGTT